MTGDREYAFFNIPNVVYISLYLFFGDFFVSVVEGTFISAALLTPYCLKAKLVKTVYSLHTWLRWIAVKLNRLNRSGSPHFRPARRGTGRGLRAAAEQPPERIGVYCAAEQAGRRSGYQLRPQMATPPGST